MTGRLGNIKKYVDVSKNSGTPNHPLKNWVFHYFHHPFWGTTIFGNSHVKKKKNNPDSLLDAKISTHHNCFLWINLEVDFGHGEEW